MSGILLADEKAEQFALNELIKIAEMDLEAYKLSQPIVCHGDIGTAAILNLMYLDTNRTEFLQRTIRMVESGMSFNIERFIENEKHVANIRKATLRLSLNNHLEGYVGIIQTILSIIKGIPTENEKRLLMM